MIPHHYSQAGQDLFALHASRYFPARTFLDIGCEDGRTINNTLLLEEHGWSGLCLDRDAPIIAKCTQHRRALCRVGDATDYAFDFENHHMGYLSLDVDDASLDALISILSQGFTFQVITAEHDAYRRHDELRAPMRTRLTTAGYTLLCSNVHHQSLPFEDWWCSRQLSKHLSPLASESEDWTAIISRAHINTPDA